jgi:phosphoglycolate phosphatase
LVKERQDVIKLILFDVDGTLIHTRGAGVKAFERTLDGEFKISQGTQGVEFAGRTDSSIVRELFRRHDISPSPENFQRFFELYVFWLDYLLSKSLGGICVGVWNFIHDLAKQPQPPLLGLLTGNIRLGAEIKLRHFQLWDYFAIGAFGDDHENRNQLAAVARQRGSDWLGESLEGSQIVVVGDTPLDIDCCEAIQAKMLAVATGGATLDALKQRNPRWAVHDLGQVSVEEVLAG